VPLPLAGYRLQLVGEATEGACEAGGQAIRASTNVAVGSRCSIGTGSIVFWTDYAGDFGSLQLDVFYQASGGSFLGIGHGVACENLAVADDGVEARFNDDDRLGILSVGLTSETGFHGPGDLFRCTFELPADSPDPRLMVRMREAIAPDWTFIAAASTLGYRLE